MCMDGNKVENRNISFIDKYKISNPAPLVCGKSIKKYGKHKNLLSRRFVAIFMVYWYGSVQR